MSRGSVFQRHTSSCPRDAEGEVTPHKCRGAWAFYVLVGRRGDGRRRQVMKSGFPTKRAADAALRELLARDEAELAEVHRLTVGAYLDGWLASKRALRATTQRSYASHLRL